MPFRFHLWYSLHSFQVSDLLIYTTAQAHTRAHTHTHEHIAANLVERDDMKN